MLSSACAHATLQQAQTLDAPADTDLPAFSEDDLLGIYEDLLALPDVSQQAIDAPAAITQEERELRLVQGVYERLFANEPSIPDLPLGDTNAGKVGMELSPELSAGTSIASTSDPRPYLAVLARVRDVVSKMEASKGFQLSTSVPVGVMSMDEWEALARVAIREHDGEAMESTLSLMKVCSFLFEGSLVSHLMPEDQSPSYGNADWRRHGLLR